MPGYYWGMGEGGVRLTGKGFARSARLSPALLLLALALALYAVPLASYWGSYFPYEDDFSLIYYSGHSQHLHPAEWFTLGYSRYFDNGSACAARKWGYARPVINATFYLESYLANSENYSAYLLTNILCYLVSVLLVYYMAIALGTKLRTAMVLALIFAISPVWHRILYHASFRPNGLCTMWTLAGVRLLLSDREFRAVHPLRQLAAGVCALFAAASHEQGYFALPLCLVLSLAPYVRTLRMTTIPSTLAAAGRVAGPPLLYIAAVRFANANYGHNYALSTLSQVQWPYLAIGATVRCMLSFTPVDLKLLGLYDGRWIAAPWIANMVIFLVLIPSVRRWREDRASLVMAVCFVLAAVPVAAYPAAEVRFQGTTAAMGVVLLAAALAGATGRRRLRGSVTVCIGLLGVYGAICYGQGVVQTRSHFQQRSVADRATFLRLRNALRENPSAEVVLANDQMGTWSARAMVALASTRAPRLTVLPTAAQLVKGFSFDYTPAIACPVELTQMERGNEVVLNVANLSKQCGLRYYGVDLSCVCRESFREGLASNCERDGSSERLANRTTFVIPRSSRPLIIANWETRGAPAKVSVVPPLASPDLAGWAPGARR